jgi:hypothetical protein
MANGLAIAQHQVRQRSQLPAFGRLAEAATKLRTTCLEIAYADSRGGAVPSVSAANDPSWTGTGVVAACVSAEENGGL